ncbi:head GIN domain-containing protein [Polaribacter sp. NJDZ03]|uniref:head GIN domain-containing protein n=1 Tax=Polaribacter sp. NJDZ03 TaxID=2855841 RepID=UPI001C49F9E5|nr:head GIN domain-containing protein [Polaribacter sp. NJDZ03]
MNKKIFLTSLILTVSFTINAQNWFGSSKQIKGNGNLITLTKTTETYKSISIGGSFDVILVKGKEGKITLEGEENILPFIETEVSDGTLKVKFKNNTNISTTKKLTVTVPYIDIESVALGGSGNILSESLIKANNFSISLGGSGNITLKVDANNIKAAIGGSGNMNLEGSCNEFTCSIAGSGDISAYGLQTDEVYVNVAGSGSVKTSVSSKIEAKLVGSGNVYYKGNPAKVNSKSVGSGSVVDKN